MIAIESFSSVLLPNNMQPTHSSVT